MMALETQSNPGTATTRGVYFLNKDQTKVWTQAQRIAREHTPDEYAARDLMGRAALLAAEQLLARKAAA